jgi:hypothetical protein
MVLCSAATTVALFAGASWAHDPADFERKIASPPAAKAVPTTCAQLADAGNYLTDLSNPDIKALQARCDAEKKAAADKAK